MHNHYSHRPLSYVGFTWIEGKAEHRVRYTLALGTYQWPVKAASGVRLRYEKVYIWWVRAVRLGILRLASYILMASIYFCLIDLYIYLASLFIIPHAMST